MHVTKIDIQGGVTSHPSPAWLGGVSLDINVLFSAPTSDF